jgi:cell division protein ZapA (FtsZ GTPase activity inhibitor)
LDDADGSPKASPDQLGEIVERFDREVSRLKERLTDVNGGSDIRDRVAKLSDAVAELGSKSSDDLTAEQLGEVVQRFDREVKDIKRRLKELESNTATNISDELAELREDINELENRMGV